GCTFLKTSKRKRARADTRLARVRVQGVAISPWSLLDLDLRSHLFELLLDCRRLVLRHAFLDCLGRALDEVLGFLQSETRDFANDLDDVDLVGADLGEVHREFGLLFGGPRP